MLTKLRIQNFKNWADTSDIRLAPITVFFGSNSAGKSSLLQFLLMLRQTAESPDRRRVLHLGDSNTPVELGTLRDLVFNHDLSKEISFEIEWDLPSRLPISDPLGSFDYSGESISFEAAIGFDLKEQVPRITRLKYQLGEGDDPLTVSMRPVGSDNSSRQQFELEASPYKLLRNPGRPWKLPSPVRFYGFPEEVSAYYQNASFTSDLTLSLEQEMRRIQYLGPVTSVRLEVEQNQLVAGLRWIGIREALLKGA